MKPYVAVVHLVRRVPGEPDKSANRHQWLYVSDIAYFQGQGIFGSADDARDIVEDAQPGSKVIVWEPDWWGGEQAIKEYLGVACEWKRFEPSVYFGCPNCGEQLIMDLRGG